MQKLYGYKVEMSFIQIYLAISASNYFTGSTSDLEIFSRMMQFNEVATEKNSSDIKIDELGELHDDQPNRWDILLDNGYQGAKKLFAPLLLRRSLCLE